jgi:hypothetical protein
MSLEVESGDGPWSWYLKHRGHSSIVQKNLVPWLIGLHGIGYSKIKKDKSHVSEMVVALCSEHKPLQGTTALSPAKAAEMYPIAFCRRLRKGQAGCK